MIAVCPICGSAEYIKLEPVYTGRCVTSQLFYCDGLTIENRCCAQCGFIFNAAGTRGVEEKIYTPSTWKPKPVVLSFGAGVKSLQERALESFKKLISLPPQGSLLDFGAGTGAFLRVFHNDHPEWELTAIEPGGGFAQISDGLPLKQAYNAPFYNLDVRECFDAVVVMSVLEHLTNPLHALHWIRERLKPDGVLLMQHPNFAAMPGDLLCVDHINKLTPAHTAAVCGYIGLAPVAAQESGSMFELVCRQSSIPSGNFAWPAAENRKIAKSCEAVAQATIRAVKQAVESARAKNGKAAIFGSSPVGNMSVYILGCEKDVACYVDENSNNWGRIQDGIPITSPAEMEKFGVSDLVIAISPVYWETVSKKMRAYPVTVHVPEIFTSGECHES